MFRLTEDELQNGYDAIEHHGHSALIPILAEWSVVRDNWEEVRAALADIDLDNYRPLVPLRVYAPKNRYNVRAVTLLHPQDLIIYTALVLLIRDDVEDARVPRRMRKVYSYRADTNSAGQLYQSEGWHQRYRTRLGQKANLQRCNYVAIADVADFFPRIYQHRLENIVESVSTQVRTRDVARVLVRKLLNNLSGGASYGIPVGPFASRVLGEAVLIDVDSALINEQLDHVRWVDDFSIFCRTEQEAQFALFFLARWLFDHHGLTLQATKTKIISTDDYREHLLTSHEDRLRERSEGLLDLWGQLGPYEAGEDFLDEGDIAQIQALNLRDMLDECLEDPTRVDYELASFILGRVASLTSLPDEHKRDLIQIVLDNIEHVYPVAESVARFFLSFRELSSPERRQISDAILRPLVRTHSAPDYYAMWILSIFSQDPAWGQSDRILALYRNSSSEVVRRYAALALAAAGNRNHALAVRDDFDRASPLLQLAILACSRALGRDERRFWRNQKLIRGVIESRI